jgi:hypothetical protein
MAINYPYSFSNMTQLFGRTLFIKYFKKNDESAMNNNQNQDNQ